FNGAPPSARPGGITAGPSGEPNSMWYTENATGNIGRITTTAAGGDTGSAFPLASGGAPVAIVAGPAGHIWFTEQLGLTPGSGGTIGEMTTAGVVTELPVDPVTTTVGLDGLAVGPDVTARSTALWFTEQHTGTLVQTATCGSPSRPASEGARSASSRLRHRRSASPPIH